MSSRKVWLDGARTREILWSRSDKPSVYSVKWRSAMANSCKSWTTRYHIAMFLRHTTPISDCTLSSGHLDFLSTDMSCVTEHRRLSFLEKFGVQNLNWSDGRTDRWEASLLKPKIDEAIGKNKLLSTPKRRPVSDVIRPVVLMFSKTTIRTQGGNIPFVFI